MKKGRATYTIELLLMILLFGFAFLAGLVTILAPCIWPLLPLILSTTSLDTKRLKPLGVTLGIMVSFSILTLSLSYLVKLLHFDPTILRLVAVIVIGLLGLSLLIPSFSLLLEGLVSRMTGFFSPAGQPKRHGLGEGFFTGLSLGIIWTPCAGPILAAIATLSATGKVNLVVVGITAAYVLGVGMPLFLFAYAGQYLFTKTRFISAYTPTIQKIFGLIMILTAFAIYTNYDSYLESQLLNTFPSISSTLTSFETNNTVSSQLQALKGNLQTPSMPTTTSLLNTNSPAPDFVGITQWLNTSPLSLEKLKGKVVLVDFWTYTCINCIRTLPHVTSWYNKYKDDGFVVVGVHTPEFAFEHETTNVQHALTMFGITYPVAQDNDYTTWNAYNNQYWPAEYLIDAQGRIRRTHFGEGEYDQMEEAIQQLLRQAGRPVSSKLDTMTDQTPTAQLSPETYLGAYRMEYYYPSGSTGITQQNFTLQDPVDNSFSLGGTWNITNDNAVTGNTAVLSYNFYASKVFLVLRPPQGKAASLKVFLDGKEVTDMAGTDVKDGGVTVDSDRLYNLIDLHGKTEQHILKLEFDTPGTQVFAFTFG